MITLVTGGARSGKSSYALQLALARPTRAFVATAVELDAEMAARIARHRADRGDTFVTIEEPYDLAGAIESLGDKVELALIDCLTVWLGNLIHRHGNAWPIPEATAFMDMLADPPCDLVIVTNEVGSGIVPDNILARHYRDIAGTVNQQVAGLADEVILTVSGIPVTIKGKGTGR
jgi:adenosylcobinamide kinase/adenosylcobinamide-phosphate guanylyltransferase